MGGKVLWCGLFFECALPRLKLSFLCCEDKVVKENYNTNCQK